MHLLEKVLPFKKFNFVTFVGLLVVIAISKIFGDPEQAKALSAGYLFCWGNISALSYLGGLLVASLSSENSKPLSKHLKGFAMLLGFVKFFLFIIILFVLVSVMKLSPIFLFSGAFTALIIMASAMSYFYLNYVKELAHENKLKHEAIQKSRIEAKKEPAQKLKIKSASDYILNSNLHPHRN